MEITDPDLTGAKLELGVLRERQKHSDNRIIQLEQELAKAYASLGSKEKELEYTRNERIELNVKHEVLKKELTYTQKSLVQNSQEINKKKLGMKMQAFLASLIFLLSSALVNVGTSMLTSSPPNPSLGWTMLTLAGITYIVGAAMTTLLAQEGGSQ